MAVKINLLKVYFVCIFNVCLYSKRKHKLKTLYYEKEKQITTHERKLECKSY